MAFVDVVASMVGAVVAMTFIVLAVYASAT